MNALHETDANPVVGIEDLDEKSRANIASITESPMLVVLKVSVQKAIGLGISTATVSLP